MSLELEAKMMEFCAEPLYYSCSWSVYVHAELKGESLETLDFLKFLNKFALWDVYWFQNFMFIIVSCHLDLDQFYDHGLKGESVWPAYYSLCYYIIKYIYLY